MWWLSKLRNPKILIPVKSFEDITGEMLDLDRKDALEEGKYFNQKRAQVYTGCVFLPRLRLLSDQDTEMNNKYICFSH